MSQRDPLVKAALSGPLAEHGGATQAERASGLTAQTLRRVKNRDDIPLLAVDHFDDVDWDEYADYLETLGATLRQQLAELPASASGRTFTADDLRADLLIRLAQRLREADLTDATYWRLTVQLRHEALAGTPVLQEGWNEPADGMTLRAERTRVLDEVADQISAFRTEGPAALARLDAGVLARARAKQRPAGPELPLADCLELDLGYAAESVPTLEEWKALPGHQRAAAARSAAATWSAIATATLRLAEQTKAAMTYLGERQRFGPDDVDEDDEKPSALAGPEDLRSDPKPLLFVYGDLSASLSEKARAALRAESLWTALAEGDADGGD
ncbi:hypothetical protein AB0G83_07485 [Streptomyces klenkii]|uniref:hypothetical protein n=1 Tax=Streptomyces klenkii TaxID=1420899 RepID=UPI0033F274F9